MTKIDEETLQKAVSCVWEHPGKGKYEIRSGMGRKFNSATTSIIEQINIDNHQKKISEHGFFEIIKEILMKLSKESIESDDSIDLENCFQKIKDKVFSQEFSSDLNKYEIVFPLNFTFTGALPEVIDLGPTNLNRIGNNTWTEEYLEKALEAEHSNFQSFYEENPNDPEEFGGSYWLVNYESRDVRYAIFEVKEHLELLLAEINFNHYLWTRSSPRFSLDSHPRDRWSQLQLPFTYLAFSENQFENYYAADYDYRGNRLADHTFMSDIDSLDDLPQLYKSKNNLSRVDNVIKNGLVLYQHGITEPSIRRAFLDFWRGVEHLASQKDMKNKHLVDRGIFAAEHEADLDNGFLKETEEAIADLAEKRNSLVHDWPESQLSVMHRNAAKILLDGLLKVYLDYREDFTLEDFECFLKFGAMNSPNGELNRISEILDMLDNSEKMIE